MIIIIIITIMKIVQRHKRIVTKDNHNHNHKQHKPNKAIWIGKAGPQLFVAVPVVVVVVVVVFGSIPTKTLTKN